AWTSAFSASTSLGNSRGSSVGGGTRRHTHLAHELAAKSRSSRVDSGQDHHQFLASDLDHRRAFAERLEAATFEALAQDPEAVPIPHQKLHAIAVEVEEAEEVTAARVLAEVLAYDPHQTIYILAEVARPRRCEDPDRARQSQHCETVRSKRTSPS